jgi:hypothetical protein
VTAQIAEKLRYQYEWVAICKNPLSDYFAVGGFNYRFEQTSRRFVAPHLAADRRIHRVDWPSE